MEDRCPYLEENGIIRTCGASKSLFVPSIDRYKTHCSSDDHYRCTILLGHVMRAGRAAVAKRHAMGSTRWAEK